MIGLDLSLGVAGELIEFSKEDVRSRGPVIVAFVEIFGGHDPVGRDDVPAGIGEPIDWIIRRHTRVDDAESVDCLVLRVREQRKRDAGPLGEVSQDLDAVVADGRDVESLFCEISLFFFQLDQLGFAVMSPIGGAMETAAAVRSVRPARTVSWDYRVDLASPVPGSCRPRQGQWRSEPGRSPLPAAAQRHLRQGIERSSLKSSSPALCGSFLILHAHSVSSNRAADNSARLPTL